MNDVEIQCELASEFIYQISAAVKNVGYMSERKDGKKNQKIDESSKNLFSKRKHTQTDQEKPQKTMKSYFTTKGEQFIDMCESNELWKI